MAQQTMRVGERDIFLEAPPAPRRGARFFVILGVAVLIMAWSFQGAKLRPGELIQGIPQIAITVGRMLPPDFSKVTDVKSYFFPAKSFLLPHLVKEGRGKLAMYFTRVRSEERRVGKECRL